MSKTLLVGLLLLGAIGFTLSFLALNSVIPILEAKVQTNPSETGVQTWVIFGSIVVAFIAIMVTSYHHERTQKIQNTLNTLQSLRTDKDYIDRARVIKAVLKSDIGKPISAKLLVELREASASLDLCEKCRNLHIHSKSISFPESVDFVLNQYEFIAGAVRLGSADIQMLNWTVRSIILTLLKTFSPYIVLERRDNPRTWANLVWLADQFEPGEWAGKLGGSPPS